MTTQEKIDEIVNRRYCGYKGIWGERFKRLHKYLRKYNTDEQFLKHLQECDHLFPKPVYGQPYPTDKLIINQPINNMEQKSQTQQLADLQQKYRRRTRRDLIMLTIAFIGLIGGIIFTCYVHKEIKKFDQKLKTMQHEPVQETKGK